MSERSIGLGARCPRTAAWMLRISSAVVVLAPSGRAGAQILDLPERQPAAPTGTRFAAQVQDLTLEEREEHVLEGILAGNVPSWLRTLTPIRIDGPAGETITIRVTVDYLAVGSDTDYLLVPMTPGTAQRIADALDMSLPTSRLVDLIWSAAEVRLTPAPIPPSDEMTTVPVFRTHSATIDAQRRSRSAEPGVLTAGHKKDVVISAGVDTSPGRVAIYGWHRPDGRPIQPLYLGHTDRWVDYSHGVRLVHREILVDGAAMDLWAALGDPDLASALSSEGPVARPRYRWQGGGGMSAPPASFELAELGPFLDSLALAEGVPGLSFAVFDDEGVLFEHVSGVKNRETREPVDSRTVFEAASISKPVFAYAVLSLVLDGVLDLDEPLVRMVPEIPEVGYDPRAALLTPRLLLSHKGGLPNWRSRLRFEARDYSELFAPGDTLRFISDPGTEYRYSGEGYVLLQRVVEEHNGTPVSELVRSRVFEPLGMRRSSFLFDAGVRDDAAYGHDADGVPDKWIIGVPLASSTLHTTATDLARFGVELASQIREDGPHSVLASRETAVEAAGDRSLSWGLGLGIVEDGSGTFVYHGGNNVIFIADLIYGVEANLGYALLTNSANGQGVVEALERRVFGRVIRE